jgi:DNA-binding protein YbaB
VVEDLIAAACNDAVRRVAQAQQERMSGMASGLGLPLGNLPF